MKYNEKMGCKFKETKMHRVHESKEGLIEEAFEHEPEMNRVPRTTISIRGKR